MDSLTVCPHRLWMITTGVHTHLLRAVIMFMAVTGSLPGLVTAFKELGNINGKLYMLSDDQRLYLEMDKGCAAMNASPAFLDTNKDFVTLRDWLSVYNWPLNIVIFLNITKIGLGPDTHYFWGHEEVNSLLWWPGEPNSQGASDTESIVECGEISGSCRPVIMTRVRPPSTSNYHQLMDTCCLYYRYYLCQDIDECSFHDNTLCPENSYCNNTAGSYTCPCSPGYQKQSEICLDIDECSFHDNTLCPENSYCNNTAGNYTCPCSLGYQKQSEICLDIDECIFHGNNLCQENSYCNNTAGNYTCPCSPGYQKQSEICLDIDECIFYDNTLCPEDSYCNNTPGNYTCPCSSGYQKQSEICLDIDECSFHGNTLCLENSYCNNTPGNYTCPCSPGYQKQSEICQDMNECLSDTICPEESRCHNTIGSYLCICNEGLTHQGVCEEAPSRPYITIASPTPPIRPGNEVTLSCNRSSSDSNQTSVQSYQWLKDNILLNATDHLLRLLHFGNADFGSYQCFFIDGRNLPSAPSTPFILNISRDTDEDSSRTTKKCPCSCHCCPWSSPKEGLTVTRSHTQMKIDQLSSYIRARSCAQDSRPSSVTVGSTTTIILLILLFLVIALDSINVVRYIGALCRRHSINPSGGTNMQEKSSAEQMRSCI